MRNLWPMHRLRDSAVVSSLSTGPILSQEAEPVAHKGDREVCVYVEQVVLSWLLVFVGAGCHFARVKIHQFFTGCAARTAEMYVTCQGMFPIAESQEGYLTPKYLLEEEEPRISENPGNNRLLTKQHDSDWLGPLALIKSHLVILSAANCFRYLTAIMGMDCAW
ncbi:unnamed protein product [Tetraodon nigroviridis]|uniref:(spotted green pufferfish) hypothetical protein n=1 Tax=Tetraodon nigroviridis TaxID=99883 RepID=Q4SIC4_TETNG|nr:unnamed protein product [Tetraodon nigroviridis]